MTDLKKVYQALTIEEAEMAFEEFKEKWGKQHPTNYTVLGKQLA
jgi:transposase-like protein